MVIDAVTKTCTIPWVTREKSSTVSNCTYLDGDFSQLLPLLPREATHGAEFADAVLEVVVFQCTQLRDRQIDDRTSEGRHHVARQAGYGAGTYAHLTHRGNARKTKVPVLVF